MKTIQNRSFGLLFAAMLPWLVAQGQVTEPVLVGYWHNWNDFNAPYIPLNEVDDRYDWIEIAFALPTSPTDMTLVFQPEGVTPSAFADQIAELQSNGKKVLLSIGGATASVDLALEVQKNQFISSASELIDFYGFDGIDIDIEYGNSILNAGGSIAAPENLSQLNLIDAIEQIMAHHRATHGEKLLLTMAPETAYVQGGQAAFGNIWGGYLPIIDALRDSLDGLQVQLYNSGSMPGLDQVPYAQGTADFIVAMTEAVIQGFSTAGGYFEGLPAHKVMVALPACPSAAGGGYADAATVSAALQYLMGQGSQPGSYALVNVDGYWDLGGMMTWSINWDAAPNCGGAYDYAGWFEDLFQETNDIATDARPALAHVYPNPSQGPFRVAVSVIPSTLTIHNALGQVVLQREVTSSVTDFQLDLAGTYWVQIHSVLGTETLPLVVGN